jgi:hypothetical protein
MEKALQEKIRALEESEKKLVWEKVRITLENVL